MSENLWPFFFEVDLIQWKAKRERSLFVTIEASGLMHWLDYHGRTGPSGYGLTWFTKDGTERHFRGDKELTPEEVEREKQEFTIDVQLSDAEFQPIRELIESVGKPWTAGWNEQESRKFHTLLEDIYWRHVNKFVFKPFDKDDAKRPPLVAHPIEPSKPKTLEEKWKTFVEWSQVHNLVLVCRRCGSGFLDAGLPRTQLKCCTCGNSTHFDDERFAGLRVNFLGGSFDGKQKQQLLERFGRDFGYVGTGEELREKDKQEGDIHNDLLNSINTFLASFSTISSKLLIDPEARTRFCEYWESAKARIDLIISEFKKLS